MKRLNWAVGPYGVRPAGKSDQCFYCSAKVGTQHTEGCVIRHQTVVIRATFELVVDVPEDWDGEHVEYLFNEKMCPSDVARRLSEVLQAENHGVLDSIEVKYVREATAEDEEDCGVKVLDLKT